jgi:ribosomal protein S27E
MPKGDIVRQPNSTTEVKCLKCEKVLAKPSGGKAKLEPIAREVEVLP